MERGVQEGKWKQREKTIFVFFVERVAKTEWKEVGLSSDS